MEALTEYTLLSAADAHIQSEFYDKIEPLKLSNITTLINNTILDGKFECDIDVKLFTVEICKLLQDKMGYKLIRNTEENNDTFTVKW